MRLSQTIAYLATTLREPASSFAQLLLALRQGSREQELEERRLAQAARKAGYPPFNWDGGSFMDLLQGRGATRRGGNYADSLGFLLNRVSFGLHPQRGRGEDLTDVLSAGHGAPALLGPGERDRNTRDNLPGDEAAFLGRRVGRGAVQSGAAR